jgi:hypothetical protein
MKAEYCGGETGMGMQCSPKLGLLEDGRSSSPNASSSFVSGEGTMQGPKTLQTLIFALTVGQSALIGGKGPDLKSNPTHISPWKYQLLQEIFPPAKPEPPCPHRIEFEMSVGKNSRPPPKTGEGYIQISYESRLTTWHTTT